MKKTKKKKLKKLAKKLLLTVIYTANDVDTIEDMDSQIEELLQKKVMDSGASIHVPIKRELIFKIGSKEEGNKLKVILNNIFDNIVDITIN